MTLIVGIKCKDGIVIAADGAATYAGAGGPTIRQPTRKISLIHNQAVMAVCGAVGLAQQYRGVVTEKLGNPNRYKSDVQAGNRAVRDALLPIYEQEAKAAMIQTQLKGQRSSSADCGFLLAVKAGRSLELIQFDIQGAAEVASEDLPFVSMGSGQMTADPFLAFQRRVFWLDAAPSIERGCLTAIWTIQHAIQVSPGGVGEHIDVAVLTEDNGVPTARQLEAEQLLELRQHIADAEAALGRFARGEEPEPAAAPAPTPEA